jgi:hypothetical protein
MTTERFGDFIEVGVHRSPTTLSKPTAPPG